VADVYEKASARGFELRMTADSHMAWVRTRLSVERTQMSWVRTAVSLIGFGFTIVQFFERMQGFSDSAPAYFPDAPRYLGLGLIFCGVLALVVSILQYGWMLRYLTTDGFEGLAGQEGERKQTPLWAVAIVLAVIGVFAFVAVLFRLV